MPPDAHLSGDACTIMPLQLFRRNAVASGGEQERLARTKAAMRVREPSNSVPTIPGPNTCVAAPAGTQKARSAFKGYRQLAADADRAGMTLAEPVTSNRCAKAGFIGGKLGEELADRAAAFMSPSQGGYASLQDQYFADCPHRMSRGAGSLLFGSCRRRKSRLAADWPSRLILFRGFTPTMSAGNCVATSAMQDVAARRSTADPRRPVYVHDTSRRRP